MREYGFAPVNGLQMYYEIHGPSGGVPLVLLHGGGSTIDTSFSKVLPRFAQHREVIGFEQQGHGHTADVDRPFSIAQFAKDIAAALRHLKVERADILGFSTGGHNAIQLALDEPAMVRKLVLESVMFAREGCDPSFWEMFKVARVEHMPPELKKAYLEVAPHPQSFERFFRKGVERMDTFEGWSYEQIRSIKAPTLILLGDRDIVRVEHAALMQQLLGKGTQLAVLPNTTHEGIIHADAVVPFTEAFLSAAEAP